MTTSLLLAALSVLQLATGLGANLYVLVVLGAGSNVDAFVAAQTAPVLVVTIVGTSLMNTLIPVLSALQPEEAKLATWPVLLWAAGLFTGLALLLGQAAPYWVPAAFPGFSESTDSLTIELLAVMLPGLVFWGLSMIATAVSRSQERFLLAEGVGVAASCLNIAGLVLLLKEHGIVAAAWLWTARYAVQALIIFPIAGRPVFSRVGSQAISAIWTRLRPLIFSSTIYKLGPLVDRYFLSSAAAGGMAIFNFASGACGAGAAVIEKGLVTPIVPSLTRAYVRNDIDSMRRLVRKRVLIGLGITVAGMASVALMRPIVQDLVIARGLISAPDISLLINLILILTGAAATMATGPIVVSAFYAMGNSVVPSVLGIFGFFFSVGLKIAGYSLWGVYGLAMASTLHYVINLGIAFVLLERTLEAKRLMISGAPATDPT